MDWRGASRSPRTGDGQVAGFNRNQSTSTQRNGRSQIVTGWYRATPGRADRTKMADVVILSGHFLGKFTPDILWGNSLRKSSGAVRAFLVGKFRRLNGRVANRLSNRLLRLSAQLSRNQWSPVAKCWFHGPLELPSRRAEF